MRVLVCGRSQFLEPLSGLSLTVVFLALTGVLACTGPTVRTDFDPDADFTTFRTYVFAGMTDVNQGGVLNNSLMSKRLEQMVRQQLSNKGLLEVGVDGNPDLHVYFWVGVKEKQRVQSTGPAAGVYAGRHPYGYPYGWGGGYSEVSSYEYVEGTLIVDLVTPSKKELVWRGSMVGTLRDSKEDNLKLANEAIAKAFADYPPKSTYPTKQSIER